MSSKQQFYKSRKNYDEKVKKWCEILREVWNKKIKHFLLLA